MKPIRSFWEWLRYLLEGIAIGLILSLGLSLHEANRQLVLAGEALNEARAMMHEVNRPLADRINRGPAYPPADTLYVDMAVKPGVVGMTLMAYNDTMNALLLIREDNSIDTMFFMGNTAPTVIDAPISTATFGNISHPFGADLAFRDIPDPNINLEYVDPDFEPAAEAEIRHADGTVTPNTREAAMEVIRSPNTEEWFALSDGKAARVYSTPLWTYVIFYDWTGSQTMVNDHYRPLTRKQMVSLLFDSGQRLEK